MNCIRQHVFIQFAPRTLQRGKAEKQVKWPRTQACSFWVFQHSSQMPLSRLTTTLGLLAGSSPPSGTSLLPSGVTPQKALSGFRLLPSTSFQIEVSHSLLNIFLFDKCKDNLCPLRYWWVTGAHNTVAFQEENNLGCGENCPAKLTLGPGSRRIKAKLHGFGKWNTADFTVRLNHGFLTILCQNVWLRTLSPKMLMWGRC